MRVRAIAAALAVTAAALGMAGCAQAGGAGHSVVGADSLVIGVAQNQPGLGFRSGGVFRGFDVDVATYVAGRLGVAAKNITFKPIVSGQREGFLQKGQVDLVVSSYSITADRKTKVLFAGPYYVAHQDILVPRSDTAVKNVRDLAGRRLCAVSGSVSWKRVTEQRQVPARPVPASSYGDCLTKLTGGQVDAISTDDLILAGFAAQAGPAVRFVNAPFSDERYGIGIGKQDVSGCEDINKAVTEMYQDGTAGRLLTKWFGKTGLHLTDTVPQFEGCS
jgi:glutamate transport system substrate-binding protein